MRLEVGVAVWVVGVLEVVVAVRVESLAVLAVATEDLATRVALVEVRAGMVMRVDLVGVVVLTAVYLVGVAVASVELVVRLVVLAAVEAEVAGWAAGSKSSIPYHTHQHLMSMSLCHSSERHRLDRNCSTSRRLA